MTVVVVVVAAVAVAADATLVEDRLLWKRPGREVVSDVAAVDHVLDPFVAVGATSWTLAKALAAALKWTWIRKLL